MLHRHEKEPDESPSLRGSGLKYFAADCLFDLKGVSLFTREWIEIQGRYDISRSISLGLPLYEGVD